MKHPRLESGQLSSDLVGSKSQLGQPIAPFIVTNANAGDSGVCVAGRDVHPGKDAAGFICHPSTEDTRGLLGIGAGKVRIKRIVSTDSIR